MKILVVRRDNIGDLVCTTPLLSALRGRYPDSWIGALVNSYNAPVLDGNPDLDRVVQYTKLKHLAEGDSIPAALSRRIASLWKLRCLRLDAVVLATTDFVPRIARLARWLKPREIVGFSDGSPAARRILDVAVPMRGMEMRHEVERVFSLAAHFGVAGPIPRLRVFADQAETSRAATEFGAQGGPRIGVHISARRPRQRWPAERFAALIERLYAAHGTQTMLLWAPGAPDDARHPGDDDTAAEIVRQLENRAPLIAYRTASLPALIGALSACELQIAADGGATHLAAGLGKPVLALFGDVSAERWRPWGVPHRVLQPPSQDVADLAVEQVAAGFASLAAEAGVLRNPGA
jgi:ADP-heptose:LPS heptosyltransferase